jgi:hypothetical protein
LNLYGYVGNEPLSGVDPLGLADDPFADLGHPTGKWPKGDCGSYAAQPGGAKPDCRVADGKQCNADEYEVMQYEVPGQASIHVLRQDADGTYSHQAGKNGQVYDKVKDPAKAAKCYFKHSGTKKSEPLIPTKYCCKKDKKLLP